MKQILFILGIVCLYMCPGQAQMTSSQWQEDLRFLQETVHNEYSFLFKKTTKEIFDNEVEQLYSDIPSLEEHEIIVGMSRIIALFGYGHTDISFSHAEHAFRRLPFNLYQYKDGIYIQGVHQDYSNALGAKLIAINNLPAQEAIEKIYPAVNAENDQYFRAYGLNYLGIPEVLHAQGITPNLDYSVTLSLEKDGTVFQQSFEALPQGDRVPIQYNQVFAHENWLEARHQDSTPLYIKNREKLYYFEHLEEEQAIYIRHSSIMNDRTESMAQFYDRVFDFVDHNDVEKLILDLRFNGGGNNYLNKPIITGIIEQQKINQVGKLMVIIGRQTFSACQNLVNELSNYTNVVFVGEGTAENLNFYGDTRMIALPNTQIPIFLSYAWWQDKPQSQNADGTAPHVPVMMSFEEYINNEDPVLDAALSFSGDNFKPDPMDHIVNLFAEGRMDQLRTDVISMVQDPRYVFFDFESEFIKSGQSLLGANNMAALSIFEMTSQIYPQSAKVWSALGDGYSKVGDVIKAKGFFEKALSLNPDAELADYTKGRLKELGE